MEACGLDLIYSSGCLFLLVQVLQILGCCHRINHHCDIVIIKHYLIHQHIDKQFHKHQYIDAEAALQRHVRHRVTHGGGLSGYFIEFRRPMPGLAA